MGFAKYFIDNFDSLFTSSNLNMPRNLEHLFAASITKEENVALIRIPTKEELKECVWETHTLKVSGPDRFLGIFFRSYCLTVKAKVINFVQECFRLRKSYKVAIELLLFWCQKLTIPLSLIISDLLVYVTFATNW